MPGEADSGLTNPMEWIMLTKAAKAKRQTIIDACLSMNALGIDQRTSRDISLRDGEAARRTICWRRLRRGEELTKSRPSVDAVLIGAGVKCRVRNLAP